MILFPQISHRGIKSGRITIAFRLWESCRVSKGESYLVENLGKIRIREARKVAISSISDEEAKKAGYQDADKIISHFQNKKPDQDFCFRIEFQYLKSDAGKRERRPRPLPEKVLEKINERLQRLDRKAQGITYSAILNEMGKNRYNRIRDLSESFDCPYSEIRRKLYRLSSERLVDSDPRKRYYLTPRARQLMEHKKARVPGLQK